MQIYQRTHLSIKGIICFWLLLNGFLAGCGSDSDGSRKTIKKRDTPIQVTMQGKAMSGFFLTGTQITIQALEPNTLKPTGNLRTVQTTDELGRFSLSGEFDIYQAEVIAEGYYFNPVSGENSLAPLTFRAIIDLSENMDVQINLLTTLSAERFRYLVNNENMDVADAKEKAEKEVLSFFAISDDMTENFAPFETLNPLSPEENGAFLMAAFIITHGNLTVAEFSEQISRISDALSSEEDSFSRYKTIRRFQRSYKYVNLSTIRSNMESRFAGLESSITIPDFEAFIDTNGNGVRDQNEIYAISNIGKSSVNAIHYQRCYPLPVFQNKIWSFITDQKSRAKIAFSEDGLNWEPSPDWPTHEHSAVISFKDKLWLFGGQQEDVFYSQTNDIWSSEDGISWIQVTANAPFRPRYDHEAVVFDNKIWILGGAYNTPCNETYSDSHCTHVEKLYDIWFSEDGTNWEKSSYELPFNLDYETIFIVIKDRIIVFDSMYLQAYSNPKRLIYWVSEDGEHWVKTTWDYDVLNAPFFSGSIGDKTFIGGFSSQLLIDDIGVLFDSPPSSKFSIDEFKLFETHNGITWSSVPVPCLEVVNMVSKDNKIFLYENFVFSDWYRYLTGKHGDHSAQQDVWVLEQK